MVKKLLSLFLAGLLALSSGFYVSVFWTLRHRIRQDIKTQIKQGVDENDLRVFNFSKEEFEALTFVKKNEFQLNGSFFDIVRSTEKNNTVILYCIDDKQERVLFQTLQQLVDAQHHDATKGASKQLTNYLLLKCLPLAENNKLTFNLKRSKTSFYSETEQIMSGFHQTPSPPPKLV